MVKICDKCHLKNNGSLVWGEGSLDSDVFFIGEAPGKNEAEEGRPFVGRSGKLLRRLIAECGIEKFYISNLVKHRPPDNRNPFYDEILICSPYLLEEIRKVKPKLIVTLGRVPGDWYNHYHEWKWETYYPEKRWLPLYHPSYLLRVKQEVKEKWKSALINAYQNIEELSKVKK